MVCLSEIWLTSKHYDIKLSRAMFNGKERLCVHVFPNIGMAVIVAGCADILQKTTYLEADVFAANGLGCGIGVLKWPDFTSAINYNGILLKLVLQQSPVSEQVVGFKIIDDIFHLSVLDTTNFVAATSKCFTFVNKTWQFLIHRHHTGKLAARLDCISTKNTDKIKLNIVGKLETGQTAEKSWTFDKFDTENMIFDVDIATLTEIKM